MKNRVQVNGHHISVVFFIDGSQMINGHILPGAGIQVGIHGGFQKIDKRFFERICIRTVQAGMLKNVKNTGVILRQSHKPCGKQKLTVITVAVKDGGTALMCQLPYRHVAQRDFVECPYGECADGLSDGKFHMQLLFFWAMSWNETVFPNCRWLRIKKGEASGKMPACSADQVS